MRKVVARSQQLTSSACNICFIVARKLAGMPTACATSCLCASGCSPFHNIFNLSCVVCKQQHGRWCRPAMMVSSMQAIASSITYPHEVVRSQMHVRGLGPFDGFGLICKEIWQNEGLVGFYKGWATNMFRTVPAAAITFTSFELFARLVREAGARQRATKESR